jgi:acyl-CoA synthetase (NDP forming)
MKKKIQQYRKRKGFLAENEVKDILRSYGIKTTKYAVIKNEEDLQNLNLRFPVALKICSTKILHKTELGGVKLSIEDMDELKINLKNFKKNFPKEKFLVEQMEEKAVEMIIGLVQDPTFGLLIMVGIGGIFTELYHDVSFRIVPIKRIDAKEMIEELRGKRLLEGFRGIKADKKQVIDLIIKVSKIGTDLVDNISQMDLNPVFIYKDNYCVVDAKLILR